MNNYVYILDGKAYVNLTNKCHNACSFCIRNTGDGVAGTPLWLDKEPTAADVLSAFEAIKPRVEKDEIVFCGYGEPTEALGVLKECAAAFKAAGYKLRLNTNGLGSMIAGRNIAPELKDFDVISVSLNNCNKDKYYEVTRSAFGTDAFGGVVEFAWSCAAEGINTVFTVVDTIGEEDIKRSEALAKKLGISLRVRKYVANNYSE